MLLATNNSVIYKKALLTSLYKKSRGCSRLCQWLNNIRTLDIPSPALQGVKLAATDPHLTSAPSSLLNRRQAGDEHEEDLFLLQSIPLSVKTAVAQKCNSHSLLSVSLGRTGPHG